MPKLPRVLVDTSVLISGLNSATGASAAILTLGRQHMVELLVTPYILFETEGIIERKFPKLHQPFMIFRSENVLTIVGDPSESWLAKARGLMKDPQDVPILAAALAHKARYLVTLDRKDFIENKSLVGRDRVRAILPAAFLKQFRNKLL